MYLDLDFDSRSWCVCELLTTFIISVYHLNQPREEWAFLPQTAVNPTQLGHM